MPSFGDLPLAINLALFTAAAAVVWLAGTRVAGYATTIAERTGLGKAVVGTILLGGITSLPEIATTGTAAATGNAALAVNNLLGGVAMQVVVLAIADAAIGREALSSVVARPTVLLLGALNVLMLAMVAAAITVGDLPILGLSAWTCALLGVYLSSILVIANSNAPKAWLARDGRGTDADRGNGHFGMAREDPRSTGRIVGYTVIAGIAIFAAGFLLARTGEALAEQTGLGASFVGAVFVAISTSLPEVSSTLAAVRLKQYELAFGDIFGTNLFDVALLALADALYAGPPVLERVGGFSLFGALLGIVVTTIYLSGLIERRNRVVLRMGVDSLLVLIVYLGGLVVLFRLRQ